MKKQLPNQPSLDHLKAQAKDLLRDLRAQDPNARLHHAQHQLAQEYGFESWPKLAVYVEDQRLLNAHTVNPILPLEPKLLGYELHRDLRRLFDIVPNLSSKSLVNALIGLDLEQVQTRLLYKETTGRTGVAPIALAAFSPLSRQKPAEYVEVIRFLLEQGADPNTFIILPSYPDSPLSILYAASGVANNPEACEMLLKAGANPNDNESLYHSAEFADHRCTELLLKYGAKLKGSNAMLRMLDYDHPRGVQILLEGDDYRGDPAITHAIRRGRSDAILDILVRGGYDPFAVDAHGVSAAQVAHERGRKLPGVPSPERVTDADRLLAACWSGDVEAATRYRSAYATLTPQRKKAFSDIAWSGRGDLVDAFMAGGFQHTDRDDSRATPLHAACFAGHSNVVKALLRHAPPLDDANDMYKAIPIQYAMYASEHATGQPSHGGEWVECVRLLIEAGSPMPESVFGNDAVRELVREEWPDLKED